MSAGLEGLQHYERLFGCSTRKPFRSLDRNSLPSPIQYLTEQGLLQTTARGNWAQIRCPAHKGGDESHPSMGVSLVDGHFKCHACGAKGGDIIALHRLVTGKGFRDSVAELGGRFDG